MAIAVDFSKEDIQRGKLFKPAWYVVEVNKISVKQNKKGDGVNYWITGTIINDADNGSTEFAGFPTPQNWLFSSKAKGFMNGFFGAFGIDIEEGTRYDLEGFEGKQLEVFIENQLYEGRMQNTINHKYRKLSA